MKSLKPLAAVAVASALALTGCSAGQITQTSNQVAAVDGATAFTEDRELSVQDATVVLAEDGQAAVKFTVTNQDRSMKDHTLKSVTVDGTPATLGSSRPIAYNGSLVADSAEGLKNMPKSKDGSIQYVATSVENQDFAYGGVVPVKFEFDGTSLEIEVPVSAPTRQSGEQEREADR